MRINSNVTKAQNRSNRLQDMNDYLSMVRRNLTGDRCAQAMVTSLAIDLDQHSDPATATREEIELDQLIDTYKSNIAAGDFKYVFDQADETIKRYGQADFNRFYLDIPAVITTTDLPGGLKRTDDIDLKIEYLYNKESFYANKTIPLVIDFDPTITDAYNIVACNVGFALNTIQSAAICEMFNRVYDETTGKCESSSTGTTGASGRSGDAVMILGGYP
jgi:hypothetical protein